MSETTARSAYDKLSPQRKQLADMLVANLDSGGLWKQGWRTRGAPENAVTGKKYKQIIDGIYKLCYNIRIVCGANGKVAFLSSKAITGVYEHPDERETDLSVSFSFAPFSSVFPFPSG